MQGLRRLAATAAAAVLAAGCGGGGGGSSTTNSNKGEIVIGNIGSYTGANSASIGPTQKIVQAWVNEVNGKGGLNGHHLKLVTYDDAGNATNGLNLVKQMLQQDQVVAIVADMSLVDVAWAATVQQANVPVIGGQSYSTPFSNNPDFFASGTTVYPRNYGVMAEGRKFGDKMAFPYCAEAPACKTGVDIYKAMGAPQGISVPVAVSVSAATTNFTPICQAMKDAGVQSVHNGISVDIGLRLQDACYDQGLRATQIGSAGTIGSTWLTHPSAQGTINVDPAFPYFDGSTPATKAWRDFLQRNNLGDESGGSGPFAYSALKVFEKVVQGISGTVTSDAIKQQLYKFKDETIGGLTPPLTFVSGQPNQVYCWYVDKIQNNQWVAPQGLKTNCAPVDVITANLPKQ